MAWQQLSSRTREFDHFVVIDFEATCERNSKIYPQEIIEFPAVLVDAATGGLVASFRTYVKPRHHPRLTAFCSELTGIQQEQVDGGVDLATALAMHDAWLAAAGAAKNRLAVVTWDGSTFASPSRPRSVLGGATFRRQSGRRVCSGAAASTVGSTMRSIRPASSPS